MRRPASQPQQNQSYNWYYHTDNDVDKWFAEYPFHFVSLSRLYELESL